MVHRLNYSGWRWSLEAEVNRSKWKRPWPPTAETGEKCVEKLGRMWKSFNSFLSVFSSEVFIFRFWKFQTCRKIEKESIRHLYVHIDPPALHIGLFYFSFSISFSAFGRKLQPSQLFMSKYISTYLLWTRTFSCITIMIQLTHPRTLISIQ